MFLAQNKNPKKTPKRRAARMAANGEEGVHCRCRRRGWTDASNPSSYVVISGKGLLPSGRRRPRQKRLARIANFSSTEMRKRRQHDANAGERRQTETDVTGAGALGRH